MKNLSPLFAIVILGLICGCAPVIPPAQPAQGITSAGNDNAGLSSDIDAITRGVAAAKIHADPAGQLLLDQVALTAADAAKKSVATATDLQRANDDAAKQKAADDAAQAAQKKAYEIKLAKATADTQAADGHAFATHMLYILAIIGVPIFAFAVVLMLKSATTWGKSLAAGSAVLSLASVGLALTINILEAVSPIFTWCIGGLLIVCSVGIAVVFVIELVKYSKAIVAQHADSIGNKQPAVPYSPDVAKVLTKVLTPAIGSLAAEAAVDPIHTQPIGSSGPITAPLISGPVEVTHVTVPQV